jgi:hypothetical protein
MLIVYGIFMWTMGYAFSTHINKPEKIKVNTNNTLVCMELVSMCDKLNEYERTMVN